MWTDLDIVGQDSRIIVQVKIERDLMTLLPKSQWIKFSYRQATHGRTVCIARLTDLSRCFLALLQLCECSSTDEDRRT